MAAVVYGQVWEGGLGNTTDRTIARSEAEAINNLCDKHPILLAIGCSAEPLLVEGQETWVKLPTGFVYGDDKRNKAQADLDILA